MQNFIETYRQFTQLKKFLGSYRLCWLHYANKWIVIDFLDNEVKKIDPKKIDLVVI